MAKKETEAEIEELLMLVNYSVNDENHVTEEVLLPFELSSILEPGLKTPAGHAKNIWEDHPQYHPTDGKVPTPDEFSEIIEEIGTVADVEYEEIVYKADLLERTPLSIFFLLTESEWENIFGKTPAEYLESWEPVWELFEQHLISSLDTHKSDPNTSPSYDPELLIDTVRQSEKKPLVLSGGVSDELSALGVLSTKQAQAYTLREIGYKTKEIAQLMNVDTGTASSHINRAERKMAVINQASLSNRRIQDYDPSSVPHPERVGLTYTTPEGREATIIASGHGTLDNSAYVLEYENGDVEKRLQAEVNSWIYG